MTLYSNYTKALIFENSWQRVRSIDASLAALLRRVMSATVTTPTERETIVILCGDHGMSYGDFYERSRAARLDVKRPFLQVLVPHSMLKRVPDINAFLLANTLKLTTPYDVHASLLHLLQMHNSLVPLTTALSTPGAAIGPKNAKKWGGRGDYLGMGYGKSLLDAHPAARRCEEAGVPAQFCACTQMAPATAAQLKSPLFKALAALATRWINMRVVQATSAVVYGAASSRSERQGGDDVFGDSAKTSCKTLHLSRVRRGEVLQTEVMGGNMSGDALIQLSFTASSSLAVDAYAAGVGGSAEGQRGQGDPEETFESWLTLSNDFVRKLAEGWGGEGVDMPLKKWRVGLNYSQVYDTFEQESILLASFAKIPADAPGVAGADRAEGDKTGGVMGGHWRGQDVAVYVTEKWQPSHSDTSFAFRWRNPAGEVFLYSVHTLVRGWSTAWQRRSLPLNPSRGGGVGLWTIDLFRVREWDGANRDFFSLGWQYADAEGLNGKRVRKGLVLGQLLASRSFYLGVDGGKIAPEIISRFWQVVSVVRVSAYARHAACRDPRVQPDLCVCEVKEDAAGAAAGGAAGRTLDSQAN